MLENIKSSYLIRAIFSYFNEKRKLKITKYNKNLQKLNNINLVNYKIFSGKYIIYDTNGKGKIYDAYNNTLIYNGEILHGEKNGKGKEYNGYFQILYEGEYLNGERNGKGKEFFLRNGELIYEGSYLNGNRWNGKG